MAIRVLLTTVLALVLFLPQGVRAGMPDATTNALKSSAYVYIASTRKNGTLGGAAEIWFFHEGETVYVASPPATWRVRRIRAGRTAARIAVGRPDGPSYEAAGDIVADAAIHERLLEAFAKKYPERWPAWEQRFRAGLADGSRVVIRYRPLPDAR